MKKRFSIALALLLILSTYKIQNNFNFISIFNIKNIIIENNSILEDETIKKDLYYLYGTNLFLIKIDIIKEKLKQLDFVSSFEIKKIYPSSLSIKIFEKKPIAILYNKNDKFYLSENLDLINFTDNKKFENLPIIYGNKIEFEILYKNLKKVNFPIDIIKKYYLFQAKRWDLEIYEKKIIKLPIDEYIKSLENFIYLKNQKNFEKYKIFDYRVTNQIILK